MTSGDNEYNLALGERMLTTKRFLTAMGIDAKRLSTISYGEEGAGTGHDESCYGKIGAPSLWSKSRNGSCVRSFYANERLIPVLFILGFILSGIPSITGCALHAGLVDTQLDLDKIKEQQAQNQKRLETIENYFKERAGSVQRGQADIVLKVDQLGMDLQVLQGKLEELNRLMAQLAIRLDDQTFRTSRLASRLDALEGRVSTAPQTINPLTIRWRTGPGAISPDRKASIPGRSPGQSFLPTKPTIWPITTILKATMTWLW